MAFVNEVFAKLTLSAAFLATFAAQKRISLNNGNESRYFSVWCSPG